MEHLIRPATPTEMPEIVGMAAQEGWNPGLHDALLFYHADPGGFFVMQTEGGIAGCISAVDYDGKFGFIGLYIMKPEHRGKGLGIQLWNHAMHRLRSLNIGLDGVVAQQHNYRKSGFKLAYNNIRFQYINTGNHQPGPSIFTLNHTHFRQLEAFDRKHFPAERTAFLHSWIRQAGSVALAAGTDRELTGYIVVRACEKGYKAGPLFANDTGTAEALWNAALDQLPEGAEVYLDVPEPNSNALLLTERYGMNKVFETARMYNRYEPEIALQQVFGVTSFELG